MKASARLEVQVQNFGDAIDKFEGRVYGLFGGLEQRLQNSAATTESRLTERIALAERRAEEKVAACEKRVFELEQQLTKLQGQLSTVVGEALRQRLAAPDGQQQVAAAFLPVKAPGAGA